MLHPSYSELMEKINERSEADDPVVKSRYSIVMGTAKRARQMVDQGYMELEDHSRKPLSIAVEELDNGTIRILTDDEAAAMKAEQEAKPEEEAAEETEETAETEVSEEAQENPETPEA